jgi:hypothetical protein
LTQGYKLRVLPERCSEKDDRKLDSYYTGLRENGQPFSPESSAKYGPLEMQNFRDLLHEFRVKKKSSPMAQMADLYLWPMCIGGYHRSNRSYQLLMENEKLLDAVLEKEERATLGIKYSCFDSTNTSNSEPRNNKGPDLSEPLRGHQDSG